MPKLSLGIMSLITSALALAMLISIPVVAPRDNSSDVALAMWLFYLVGIGLVSIPFEIYSIIACITVFKERPGQKTLAKISLALVVLYCLIIAAVLFGWVLSC